MTAYLPSMSVRRLLAIMIALAVLVAPGFGRAGEALAAAPDHHAAMMDEHCRPHPAAPDDHKTMAGKSSCISMCVGVAVAPSAPLRAGGPAPAPAVSPIPPLHLSYLGEIATPPPKSA